MKRTHLARTLGLCSLAAIAGTAQSDSPVKLAPAMASASLGLAADEAFPLRSKYAECETISTEQLKTWFGECIIVDVRNQAEYDVIHIAGAKNILLSKMSGKDLLELRAVDDETPIVFYCNGVTCSKSYKAGEKALEWGFKNTYVYDAGVMAYAFMHPSDVEFFGSPMNEDTVDEQIISKESFLSRTVSPAEFIEMAKSGDFHVYDIRNNDERREFTIELDGMKAFSMDMIVQVMEKDGAIPAENILVLDNVGKQVKWLDYYLRESGRTNYFFLNGGVSAWKEAGYNGAGTKTDLAGVGDGHD